MPETPVTQNAAYSAIPTVQVDGQLNDKVTEQLLGMEMRESEGGMSSLELRFSNFGSFGGGLADFVFEDGAVLKLGAELKVYAGDISSPTEIFRGKITGLEERFPGDGPPDLIALAEDSLQGARMKQRSKNWDDTTLGDIVKEVAANLGLTPVVDGLDASVGTQQQFNESDLHFLRRLLARYDADLQIVGTELHASPRAQAQRNTLRTRHEQPVAQSACAGRSIASGQPSHGHRLGLSAGPSHFRHQPDHLVWAGIRQERQGLAAAGVGSTLAAARAIRRTGFNRRSGPDGCGDGSTRAQVCGRSWSGGRQSKSARRFLPHPGRARAAFLEYVLHHGHHPSL